MDGMREEFEAWAISDMWYMVARAGDGYKCDYMNTAWLSWKASRAALCVNISDAYYQSGMLEELRAQKAMFDAGVSYK